MDADTILAWAEFTTGIVEYCHRIPPDKLMRLLLTFGTNDEFSLLNLLQIIGKAHLVEYYKPKLANRERPQIPFKTPGNEESFDRGAISDDFFGGISRLTD